MLAVEASALTASLSLAEQAAIRAVLVSHPHFDHCKDLPGLAYNGPWEQPIEVVGSAGTHAVLRRTLFDPSLWLPFFDFPPAAPRLAYREARAHEPLTVAGYRVVPVPSDHYAPAELPVLTGQAAPTRDPSVALGFFIACGDASLYYTGDTGPGFAAALGDLRPDVLVTEVGLPNAQRHRVSELRHLTPADLQAELEILGARGGPAQGAPARVLAVHLAPHSEAAIRAELVEVARATGAAIEVATEGQRLTVTAP